MRRHGCFSLDSLFLRLSVWLFCFLIVIAETRFPTVAVQSSAFPIAATCPGRSRGSRATCPGVAVDGGDPGNIRHGLQRQTLCFLGRSRLIGKTHPSENTSTLGLKFSNSQAATRVKTASKQGMMEAVLLLVRDSLNRTHFLRLLAGVFL